MKHKRCKTLMLVGVISLTILPRTLLAQLELKLDEVPQAFFPGEARPVAVKFHNPADKPVEIDLRTQLYQASSTTVIPLGKPQDWKKLQVLPGQTVLESTLLTFPSVKNGTHFLVQWLDETNKALGKADVMVYPTNLLRALEPMAGKSPLGVYDPQNQLKPLLKGLAVEFEDLADAGLDGFSGNLAIIGPFQSQTQMHEGLTNHIRALAKKGKAIVWIQAPPEKQEKQDKLQPSFYSVPEKEIAVMIVQPDLVADLPENPKSQLNLIYFCQLALHPEEPSLPMPSR
jgi:hypothetical protein